MHAVRLAANCHANLDSIRSFLEESQAGGGFESLLADLFDRVIPNLQQFPDMGRDFLLRLPSSSESRSRIKRIQAGLPANAVLREYIRGDYLILYVVQPREITLISIRHHAQLSFDLRGHWS